jgi:hypothetical protein
VNNLLSSNILSQGNANSLSKKLDTALTSLNGGNQQAACGQLAAFINEVNANVKSGKLTQQQAQPLIDAANAVRTQLGCK